MNKKEIHYQIPLRGIKVSTNKIYAGTNWKSRSEIKNRILDVAESFCQPIQRVKSYPVAIEYRFIFGTKLLDTTNCTIMAKMFEDALCALKVIKDDAPQFVASTFITVNSAPKSQGAEKLDAKSKKDNAKNKDWLEIIIKPYERKI